MRRWLQAALAAGALALAGGCGGDSGGNHSGLAETCRQERGALAGIGPIETLGEAGRALRAVIAFERRALANISSAGPDARPLATQLKLALASSRRSLASIVDSDPQQTMSPIRTGAPAARRAAEAASRLVGALCRSGSA